MALKRLDERGRPLIVPCSRCLGCRLERSRQWAVRGYCELQSCEQSSFITLTYSTENLVWGVERPTLVKQHLQQFMKDLRKKYTEKKIRFFGCGEYGTLNKRPHYHLCLFGHDFSDKRHYSGKGSEALFTSLELDKIWGYGECKIGSVTFKSIAYIARYICDKKLGKEARYYEEQAINPEFVRMSLKPGLGSDWYDKFKTDLFPHDYMVVNGKKCRIPRYFSEKFKKDSPAAYEVLVKKKRMEELEKNPEEFYNLRRMRVKENIKKAQIKFAKRKI